MFGPMPATPCRPCRIPPGTMTWATPQPPPGPGVGRGRMVEDGCRGHPGASRLSRRRRTRPNSGPAPAGGTTGASGGC